jgi:hypothetical protein
MDCWQGNSKLKHPDVQRRCSLAPTGPLWERCGVHMRLGSLLDSQALHGPAAFNRNYTVSLPIFMHLMHVQPCGLKYKKTGFN